MLALVNRKFDWSSLHCRGRFAVLIAECEPRILIPEPRMQRTLGIPVLELAEFAPTSRTGTESDQRQYAPVNWPMRTRDGQPLDFCSWQPD